MKYIGIETSFSLLQAYERLALEYNRKQKPHEPILPGMPEQLSQDYENYGYSFTLLNLNAAIVEGALRSALSETIWDAVENEIKLGKAKGQTYKSPMELLLFRFQMEVDGQGGWSKLKEQYGIWLNVELDKVSAGAKEAVEVLFVLRNVLAHGGTLLQPTEEVPDGIKDDAVAAWYKKLQRARVYLKKEFKHEDVFKNLSEFAVPEHFFNASKNYLQEVKALAQLNPRRGRQTWEGIMELSFGYRCLT